MYEAFYGLRERPFDLTPNPRYLLMTSSHREALSTIQYGLSGRKGITLLLGPAGTGKTTLVHAALEHPRDNVKVLCLTNPMLSREEFFEFLTIEFGLDEALAKSKTLVLVELRRILRERREAGGFTALIID
jgi:general secretion pathway protein A